jgi:hypothetical protein
MLNQTISSRYHHVLEQIYKAADAAGRSIDEIKLVVVTKGHPVESICRIISAGASSLGENYLEEAEAKIQALAGKPVEWRMIGHVQSRKAQGVCQFFEAVDSVDSLKLAQRLDRYAREKNRILPVLLECNVSGEQSKSGFQAWDRQDWPQLGELVTQMTGLVNLSIEGLMTMPPYFDDPSQARPYFRKLMELRAFLIADQPGLKLNELSMGMSSDFEVAIQEGATMLRIGTAIMGPRPLSG